MNPQVLKLRGEAFDRYEKQGLTPEQSIARFRVEYPGLAGPPPVKVTLPPKVQPMAFKPTSREEIAEMVRANRQRQLSDPVLMAAWAVERRRRIDAWYAAPFHNTALERLDAPLMPPPGWKPTT